MKWSAGLIGCALAGLSVVAQQEVVPIREETALRGVAAPNSDAAESVRRIRTSVEQFAQLAGMPPLERARLLASRPERSRSYVEAELERFDSMAAAERADALRDLRLRYYLRELIRHPAAVRAQAVELIPLEDRDLLEKRLERWDKLNPSLQREVLDDERKIHYVLQMGGRGRDDGGSVTPPIPATSGSPGLARLDHWYSLPREQRERIHAQFRRFFDLPLRERERVLETLPENERRETLESLRVLEQLPPEERQACLESLQRVAEMPRESRASFLMTAERWKAMSEDEKRVWKRLTTVLPPGLEPPIPGGPPRPAPSGETKSAPALPGQPR